MHACTDSREIQERETQIETEREILREEWKFDLFYIAMTVTNIVFLVIFSTAF